MRRSVTLMAMTLCLCQFLLPPFSRAEELAPDPVATEIKHNTVLGDALMQNGRYQEAADAYTEVLKRQPQDKNILQARARAYESSQQYENALADYESAAKVGKVDDPDILLHRAVVLGKLNKHEDAVAELTAALRVNPHLVSALIERGSQLASLNRIDEANKDWDQAIALNPQSPALSSVYYLRARNFFQQKQYEKALSQIDASITAYPPGGEKHLLRGQIEDALGDHESARNDYGDASIGLPYGSAERAEAEFCNGFALLRNGDSKYASQNFDSFRGSKYGQKDKRAQTVAIWEALSEKDIGNAKQSESLLSDLAASLQDKRWPYPVVAYLSGQIDEEKLLAQAPGNEEKAEAECDIALNLACTGSSDALKHWQKALAFAADGDSLFRQLASARVKNFEAQRVKTAEQAIYDDHPNKAKAIVADNFDLAAAGSILTEAVIHEQLDLVRFLLEKGVSVKADRGGPSPLHWACSDKTGQIAQLLIEKGADVNAEDEFGITPLMKAVMNDNAVVVTLLLAKGADPNKTVKKTKVDAACGRVDAEEGSTALSQAEKEAWNKTELHAQIVAALKKATGKP